MASYTGIFLKLLTFVPECIGKAQTFHPHRIQAVAPKTPQFHLHGLYQIVVAQ
jgi:hypothetical protein